jgi:hypothetical protein
MPNIFNHLKRREYVFRPAPAGFPHKAAVPAHSNDAIKSGIFLTQCGFKRTPLRSTN